MYNVGQILHLVQQGQTTHLDLTVGVSVSDSTGTLGSYRTERIFKKIPTCLYHNYSIQKVQTLSSGGIFVHYQHHKWTSRYRVAILNESGRFVKKWKPPLEAGESDSRIHDVKDLPKGHIVVKVTAQHSGASKGWIGFLNSQWELIKRWNPPESKGQNNIYQMSPVAEGRLVIHGYAPDGIGYWVCLLSTQGETISQWRSPGSVGWMIPFREGIAIQSTKSGTPNESWVSFFDQQLNCLRIASLQLPISDSSSVKACDVSESGKCLFVVETTKNEGRFHTKNYDLYYEDNSGKFSQVRLELGQTQEEYTKYVNIREIRSLMDEFVAITISISEQRVRYLDYGQRDATSSCTNRLQILRTSDGQSVFETALEGEKAVPSIAPGPQREYFILDGKEIKLCNLKQGTIIKAFKGHTQFVTEVVLLSEGYFASTSEEEVVTKIWDLENGICLKTLSGVTGELIVSAGGNLIINSKDGYLTICDAPIPKRAAQGSEFQPIWDALATNKTITTCNFEGLSLKDEGIIGLVKTLKKNQTIIALSLKKTEMTDLGAKRLLEVISSREKPITVQLDKHTISHLLLTRFQNRLSKLNRKSGVDNTTTTTTPLNFTIPHELYCPISLSIMVDPVIVVEDGHSYEREEIEEWFKTNQTSPKEGSLLSSTMVIPNKAMKAQISSLHDQYPTLIDSGEVYFSKCLQREVLNAAQAGDYDLLAQLVAKDPRLLTEILQIDKGALPISLFTFALNKGPVALLQKVVELLGTDRIQKLVAKEKDSGVAFFRQVASQLGIGGAKCIGQALDWNSADYEDLLFEAISIEDLSFVEVCLGLGVSFDVTDIHGDTPLHAAIRKENATMISLLLRLGASTKVLNVSGQTPQRLAEAIGRIDLALLITKMKEEIKIKHLLDPLIKNQQSQIEQLQHENQELRNVIKLIGNRLREPYQIYADNFQHTSTIHMEKLAALNELTEKVNNI